MAFEKIIERLRQIKADIINNREADATRIALDQVALIKLRIQTRGESYSGAKFEPYVPPYAKQRVKGGYQAGYVDFTRTGRFWANIRPRVESSTVFSTTIVIEGAEDRAKLIAKGAERKRGNILRPSASEIELARKANRERIQKYMKL